MFTYGDRIKYSHQFLRSIGAYTGDIPFRTGTVKAITPSFRSLVDLVYVHWDDGPAGHVLAINLVDASKLHLERA